MDKLKLEHLAPYLPYKINYIDDKGIKTSMNTIDFGCNLVNMGWGNALEPKEIKPILKPLSDCLDKDIHFSENDIVYIRLIIKGQTFHYGSLSYQTIVWICSNHYDFQNLIKKGLAIDFNTLKDV